MTPINHSETIEAAFLTAYADHITMDGITFFIYFYFCDILVFIAGRNIRHNIIVPLGM